MAVDVSKCKICGMELKEGEDLYCNHPTCIDKRAEQMFDADV